MIRTILSKLRVKNRCILRRAFSKASVENKENEEKMPAWQIHSYDGLKGLALSNARIPIISRPTEVLIKVEASSVNPIDVLMTEGYGATTLNLMRRTRSIVNELRCNYNENVEFPLTLGRDFSGKIVLKGHAVRSNLNLGDDVWGVVPINQQGCHAKYIAIDDSLINSKPTNLLHIEAASIPYAGLTAYSALWITGGLLCGTRKESEKKKKILILGGSGGVGTMAIQLLKSQDINVVTTCNEDAVEMLQRLGADKVINYKDEKVDINVKCEGPYDIILDCCKQGVDDVKRRGYEHNIFITLNSPLLKNVDEHGLFGGSLQNINSIVRQNLPHVSNQGSVRWAFFAPSKRGMALIQDLVLNKKLTPVIQEVYPFKNLPEAYKRVSQGHLRGKLVIDMSE
ncbi:reticulon-4-interacting protein 1, mitochondrial-like [Prorops nasuta]|uniref:reticulon-4-interacting protein 1, mitochondrial-like n=1 Tax=Prorops nasuta TaxID=863751 RepID=UPI0034CEC99A